jgi:hypothetical protein
MRSPPRAPFFSDGPTERKSFRKCANEIENHDLLLPPLPRGLVSWL